MGEYHNARGGYHEYHGGCLVPWGNIIVCNLSTVGGYHDTFGGYHEHLGGTQIAKDCIPMVLNTPKVPMITPHPPTVLSIHYTG